MRGFLIVSTLTFVCLLAVVIGAQAATITVARDGSGDYRTIGDAVTNMDPGDDIYVKDGTYYEALEITKTVDIEGQSMEGVVIDANRTDTPMVLSGADGSRLSNLNFTNSTTGANEGGLVVINTDGLYIDNATFFGNGADGLFLSGSSSVYVNDSNLFENNDGIGIASSSFFIYLDRVHIWESVNDGINARSVSDMVFNELHSHNNSDGVYLSDCVRTEIHNSNISNNSANGVYAPSSRIYVYNSTVHEPLNDTYEYYSSAGFVAITNTTLFSNWSVLVGTDGVFHYKNFVHVEVMRQGNPQSGADVNATENGTTAYASEGYGGTDPKTRGNGMVMWIPLGYWYFAQASPVQIYNGSWVGASYQSWSEDREVNMSTTHTETFTATAANVIYVDDDNAGDPSMDGTTAHPYDLLSRAVDNATAWDEIVIWDGDYVENVTINKTLVIGGNGSFSTVHGWINVTTNASGTMITNLSVNSTTVAINITADDVLLDMLFIESMRLGINVTGERSTVRDSNITADMGVRIKVMSTSEIDNCTLMVATHGIYIRDTGMVYLNDSIVTDFNGHGVDIDDSAINITGTNISIGTTNPGTAGIDATSSQIFIEGSEIWTDNAESLVVSNGDIIVLNSTFDEDLVGVDVTGTISVRNYLDIFINKTNDDPAEGADVNVTIDGMSIYNTTYYNGTDPQTDVDGWVMGIIVENHLYNGSNTPTWNNVSVYARYAPSVQTEWMDAQYNIDMNSSRMVNFTYIKPAVNWKPWTRIVTPDDQVSQNVQFDYKLFDKESDLCNVYVEYSLDNSTWYPASLSGGGSNITDQASSPGGTSHTVTWRSADDLPDEDIDNVWFHLWVNDTNEGYINGTGGFHLDNDLNAPTIDIDQLVGEQTDPVFVYFNITDPEDRRSSIYVEYEYDGTWYDATEGTGGNTSSSMKTNQSGWAYVYHWRSASDLGGVDDNITFRITANDGDDDDNGTPDEITFHLDNNFAPEIIITSNSDELSEDIEIEFELTDEESDDIDIVVQYSLDDGDTWDDATMLDSLDDLESSPGGTDHTIEWDSMTDIGEIETDNAKIAIFTYDIDEGENKIATYHVDNDLDTPVISDVQLPTELYGDIDITFTIADDQEAESRVTITYSIDGGIQEDVSISSPFATGNRLLGLETSSGGEEYTFTWHSNDDLTNLNEEDVVLTFVAEDGYEAPDQSPEVETSSFELMNHLYLPRITGLNTTGEKKDIEIEYSIADLDEEDCDISVQYKTENNPAWTEATMGTGGDGDTDLASSIAGTTHTFIWDSYTDLPDAEEEVTIRVRAENTDLGDWIESDMFDLNNILNVMTELQALSVPDDHGDIDITFQARDNEDSAINITLYYNYGSWNEATITGNTTNVAVSSTWSTFAIVWKSFEDLGFVDASGLEIEIRVSDGTTDNQIGTTFDLKNGQIPRLTLEDPDHWTGTVYLNFTLEDDQSDDCDLEFEYSEDDGDTFEEATLITNFPGESPDGMVASSSGEDHMLVWDALWDLDYGNHLDLLIRLRADDGERMSVWYETDPFNLNIAAPPNDEPEGDVFPPGDIKTGDDIYIQVEVTDDDEDVTVTLYYRNGDNGSWSDVEMDEVEDTIYNASIPSSFVTGELVQYYIEIDDGVNDVVYAEDKDDDNPLTVTIFKEPSSEGGKEKKEDSGMMMMVIIIVIIGAGGAVGMLLFFKKKGAGGKPKGGEGDVAQPGAGFQPTQQQPPGAMPPHGHGAQQPPQGGAQMSVCPVCGAPVMVPPQRPVRVTCNRCQNSFDVK